MALSIFPLFARMGFVHVVLIYGTNNVNTANLTDPVKIRHREIGSQMVLAARISYALLYVYPPRFAFSSSTNAFLASGWPNSPFRNS